MEEIEQTHMSNKTKLRIAVAMFIAAIALASFLPATPTTLYVVGGATILTLIVSPLFARIFNRNKTK